MTIAAKVIEDSLAPGTNIQLSTLQLRYPRFIHAEFMTHRMFSRNASSSRAIPVKRLIEDVINDPVYPSFWGKNQPGMQAHEEHDAELGGCHTRESGWDEAKKAAIAWATKFDQAGYHKQIVNRLLEPFSHINVVVTATEWDNFFALRCHPDAQPEMRLLAEAIQDALASSVPIVREHHLPYVLPEEREPQFLASLDVPHPERALAMISTARCARVSYMTHEGKKPDFQEDWSLAQRLIGSEPRHFSPAEHAAKPTRDQEFRANFKGWQSFRFYIEEMDRRGAPII